MGRKNIIEGSNLNTKGGINVGDTVNNFFFSIDRHKLAKLNKLEGVLSQKSSDLFEQILDIREQAMRLIEDYQLNFSNFEYIPNHSIQLIEVISESLLSEEEIQLFNKYELFVLIAASYLTDIGACQKLEDSLIEDYFYDISNLTHDFIIDNQGKLKIPEIYVSPIALLAGSRLNTNKLWDLSLYRYDYPIIDFSTEKINLPYLAALLTIGKCLDLKNITLKSLIYKFENYEPVRKKEWEAAKLKIRVELTEDGERVDFKGELENQLINLGIADKINLLEKYIKSIDENLRRIPGNKKLRLKLVDNQIKCTASHKKFQISLDEDRIIDTIIGKNIYENEFIAIRELIQNAYDACVLQLSTDETYEPEISIDLTSDKLIIKDNGTGMDDFVIVNYFTKIGRSYYVENKKEKAIGRFGIGVLSYFLLCNSFTVETKTRKSDGLKFRVSKRAKHKFYYYPSNNVENGTRITIHLSPQFSLKFEELKTYLGKTFKYLKIPIALVGEKENVIIGNDNFKIHLDKIYSENTDLPFQNIIPKMKFYEANLNNEEFEGKCGVFFPKKFDDWKNFDIRRAFKDCKNIYQNGVFINNQGRFIGDLNMLIPKELTIDRKGFRERNCLESIYDIVDRKIIKKIFGGTNHPVMNYHKTLFYLLNYTSGGQVSNEKYNFFENYFFETIILISGNQILAYSKLTSFNSIGLIFSQNINLAYSKKYKIPFIQLFKLINDRFLLNFLKMKGFATCIVNTHSAPFIKMVKEKNTCFQIKLVSNRIAEFVSFEDESMCSFLESLMPIYFNKKHRIIDAYLKIEKKNVEKNIIDLFERFFEAIGQFLVSFENTRQSTIDLDRFNSYLAKINQLKKWNLSIKKEDFPIWIRGKHD